MNWPIMYSSGPYSPDWESRLRRLWGQWRTILRTNLRQPLTAKLEIAGFGSDAGGWRVDQHVRLVGDTTEDGLVDTIGFGDSGVYVSRNNGASFSSPVLVLQDCCSTTGWSAKKHVRYVA